MNEERKNSQEGNDIKKSLDLKTFFPKMDKISFEDFYHSRGVALHGFVNAPIDMEDISFDELYSLNENLFEKFSDMLKELEPPTDKQ